jgi:hypothetical protein
MIGGTILTLFMWLITDPDAGLIENMTIGVGTVATLVILLKSVFYIGMLHISRKALLDYIDLGTYFVKALETPEGSGSAIIGVGIMMLSIALVIYAATSN